MGEGVTPPAIDSIDPPARGAGVVVRDCFHIYREGDIETVALRGVDLVVEPGEYVAVMGRSGSGKSTLLNLLAAADRPSAGAITIDGIELAGASEATRTALRGRTIGHVVQTGNLVDFLDLTENVLLATALAGRDLTAAEAAAVLDRVGLAAMARRRPPHLSGGEQQRAALACVLATRPRLLLADELTGELDRATASAVLDTLDEVRAETSMTVVIVTHDPTVAARAARVVEIRDGRIAEGPPASRMPIAAAV